jgi:hypothetical protein
MNLFISIIALFAKVSLESSFINLKNITFFKESINTLNKKKLEETKSSITYFRGI